jgi:3-oxoacyl-[acyl-carrier protein] reductase
MNLHLDGKVALVTGSSRGLGLASARALLAEGCRVCVCARGEEQLNAAAAELRSLASGPDAVLAVAADLTAPVGMDEVFARVFAEFGGIDILVNSLGLGRGAGIMDTGDAEWQEAFDSTLYPAIRASRLAIPSMRARGGGAIVMIASIYGRESPHGLQCGQGG